MPELAEVERSRRLLQRLLAGRVLARVTAAPDDKVFANLTPKRFAAEFRRKRVVSVHRKGKHLIVEVEGAGPNMYFHQGMTGAFSARAPAGKGRRGGASLEDQLDFKDFKVDTSQWPPKFTKCLLVADDGVEVAFTNTRRFGRVLAVERLFDNPRFRQLGPDPLLEMPPPRQLTEKLGARKAPVKAVLLDQGFLAGIGNWIADEVLYQARVHPQVPGNALTAAQAGRIVQCITYVVTTACGANAEHGRFPAFWLFHNRWANKKAGTRDFAGHPVTFTTVGGRTAAWVAAVQHKKDRGGGGSGAGGGSSSRGAAIAPLFDEHAGGPTRAEWEGAQQRAAEAGDATPTALARPGEAAAGAGRGRGGDGVVVVGGGGGRGGGGRAAGGAGGRGRRKAPSNLAKTSPASARKKPRRTAAAGTGARRPQPQSAAVAAAAAAAVKQEKQAASGGGDGGGDADDTAPAMPAAGGRPRRGRARNAAAPKDPAAAATALRPRRRKAGRGR